MLKPVLEFGLLEDTVISFGVDILIGNYDELYGARCYSIDIRFLVFGLHVGVLQYENA
jgi:hypothetical protein